MVQSFPMSGPQNSCVLNDQQVVRPEVKGCAPSSHSPNEHAGQSPSDQQVVRPEAKGCAPPSHSPNEDTFPLMPASDNVIEEMRSVRGILTDMSNYLRDL